MTAEQNFDWLDKQVEGLLNDFEGGESTLEETKNGFYEIIFDKLIKQIQEQQDYKQEIDEAKPKWQYTKPDKPCLFVARYNEKDGNPSLLYAVNDGGVLVVADTEDNFVSTMEEYADCQYFIVEYLP